MIQCDWRRHHHLLTKHLSVDKINCYITGVAHHKASLYPARLSGTDKSLLIWLELLTIAYQCLYRVSTESGHFKRPCRVLDLSAGSRNGGSLDWHSLHKYLACYVLLFLEKNNIMIWNILFISKTCRQIYCRKCTVSYTTATPYWPKLWRHCTSKHWLVETIMPNFKDVIPAVFSIFSSLLRDLLIIAN